MFILGFGDTFHKVNMSNKNGAIDFLKYFIASGKSVLFTHDFLLLCIMCTVGISDILPIHICVMSWE